jgi:threonine dehydratase
MTATTRGLSAEIMVPQTTPKTKLDAIQRAGGTINLIDGDYEEALARAETFAKDTGAVLVPSYDHVDTIYGNQQVFEEIKEDLGRSNHPVFAPIGGGGILSGAIQAHADLDTHIFGVELHPYQRVRQIISGEAKEIPPFTETPVASTEGVAIRTLGVIPSDIIRSAKNLTLISVTVDDLRSACRWLWFSHGVRAELGGCTALAGALKALRVGLIKSTAVCFISGGNISATLHQSIIRDHSGMPQNS